MASSSTTAAATRTFLMMTSMSISRYRTMAEAKARGTQPSGAGGVLGTAYRMFEHERQHVERNERRVADAIPQTIHRSCRRGFTTGAA